MRAALVFALLFAGACGPTITMTDDIDLTWDWGPTLTRFEDSLHGPYVRGAKMEVYVSSDDDSQSWTGWTIASTDPTIVEVGATVIDQYGLSATGHAVGAGECNLVVLDAHGGVVGKGKAKVALPDRVELDAHAYLIVGRDSEAPVHEARVLEGGEATYLVKYFAGDEELHGNGVLTTGNVDGVYAQPRTTYLFENREWLSVTATQTGIAQLRVLVDGAAINDLQVVAVDESAIDGLALIPQSEDGASDGDWFVALAQSYDSDGRKIFGVDYLWDIDGTLLDEQGDLYRYAYKSGDWKTVSASRAGHTDSMQIQSDHGYVDSSNNLGCNAGGAATAGPLVLVGMLGLVLRRRKRR